MVNLRLEATMLFLIDCKDLAEAINEWGHFIYWSSRHYDTAIKELSFACIPRSLNQVANWIA